jgi:hypothetical protein
MCGGLSNRQPVAYNVHRVARTPEFLDAAIAGATAVREPGEIASFENFRALVQGS